MKKFDIKSETEPNKTYFVRYTDKGEWLCNCPDFLVRGRRKGTCKHIEQAKKKIVIL